MTLMNYDHELLGSLGSFPAISLPDLQAEASFLTRKDRKYVVPINVLAGLLIQIEPGVRVLEIDERRVFRYATRYFDDAHTAYYRALRRRPDRFKVRTRRYLDRDECQLEVKVIDGRGRTVKSRLAQESDRAEELTTIGRAWLRSFEHVRSVASQLEPSVATHYCRATLVFPRGEGRMTIDRDLTFAGDDGARQRLVDHCIVETKGSGRALSFDRLLWTHGYRPVSASKFALGVCLAHPELPDNRWHRLRAELAPWMTPVSGEFRFHRDVALNPL